ncbi:HK97-gp10 family putative phage morphogenesis protein [Nioella ostreopsis]|uniref:HK97-gp10 family putative phage morphogenesis protein n=1 Tax=Nioella ostreopsis TaxID=2448479 RepID=UPI000FD7515B|nr:HK97-gp10 family putative phage morphogenesis protein [Nioella ostreopsis]
MTRKYVHGSEKLDLRLSAIPAEVLAELRPALVKGANEVADNMRALVPVKEGKLHDSIEVTGPGETTPPYAAGGGSVTAKPNQALVTVGNEDVRTGHLQEFGTVHHDAQPFMRPGFRIAKPRVFRRIQRAISKAIKNAGTQ